jgi:hypothetical protein
VSPGDAGAITERKERYANLTDYLPVIHDWMDAFESFTLSNILAAEHATVLPDHIANFVLPEGIVPVTAGSLSKLAMDGVALSDATAKLLAVRCYAKSQGFDIVLRVSDGYLGLRFGHEHEGYTYLCDRKVPMVKRLEVSSIQELICENLKHATLTAANALCIGRSLATLSGGKQEVIDNVYGIATVVLEDCIKWLASPSEEYKSLTGAGRALLDTILSVNLSQVPLADVKKKLSKNHGDINTVARILSGHPGMRLPITVAGTTKLVDIDGVEAKPTTIGALAADSVVLVTAKYVTVPSVMALTNETPVFTKPVYKVRKAGGKSRAMTREEHPINDELMPSWLFKWVASLNQIKPQASKKTPIVAEEEDVAIPVDAEDLE